MVGSRIILTVLITWFGEWCTEIRKSGITEKRLSVPFSIPKDARTRFLNQRNMYGNPELRSYGKPDFRPALNP